MGDVNLKDSSAAEFGAGQVIAATKHMQDFAVEIAAISRESIERTSQAVEQIRHAHGLSEVLAIQTKYMRDSLEGFSEHSRKVGELMAAFPIEISRACADAWTKSLNAAVKTTEETAEKTAANVDRLSQTFRGS